MYCSLLSVLNSKLPSDLNADYNFQKINDVICWNMDMVAPLTDTVQLCGQCYHILPPSKFILVIVLDRQVFLPQSTYWREKKGFPVCIFMRKTAQNFPC